jgi:hypothetical protein
MRLILKLFAKRRLTEAQKGLAMLLALDLRDELGCNKDLRHLTSRHSALRKRMALAFAE